MKQYWIAITGDRERIDTPKKSWWCMPNRAKKGDAVFLYFPRSISYSKTENGIFAEYKISVIPQNSHDKNYMCQGFGIRHNTSLGYAEIVLVNKFNVFLTAKEIRYDSELSQVGFVGKNFQGTTFGMSEENYLRIITLIREKEKKLSNIKMSTGKTVGSKTKKLAKT